MTAPVRPAGSKALQNTKWMFLATIAATTLIPTTTEISAGGSLDISCYIYSSSDKPSQNVNRATAPQRNCDGALYERLGTITYSGGTLHVSWDPQGATGSAGKAAWAKLAGGTTGFLVRRSGKGYAGDCIVGDFVDVWPVEFATPFPDVEGDGDQAENSFDSAYGITGPPALNVAIAT